jgi:hypothetical protein
MSDSFAAQSPLRYEVEVLDQGRIELQVPFQPGQRVIVMVVGDDVNEFGDLVAASSSSLEFWDNPIDDAEWNNA